jgi:Icc-related predicted phosphoesterase
MTGKAIVPLVKQSDGTYSSNFLGRHFVLKSEKELKEHESLIVDAGWYVYETHADEIAELSKNEEKVNEIFREKVTERIREWITIAETNLRPKKRTIIVTPGNDDQQFIDPIIADSDVVIGTEGKLINLDQDHEMISSGWSNPTPWDTARECSEEQLQNKIEAVAKQVNNMQTCVFNLHAPPFGSGLDSAPKLSKSLQTSKDGETAPVGSTAVLNAIQKYQPLLGLHGHIHESMGTQKIGRTVCVNPGSNYSEGILSGVIVVLDHEKVKSTVFTAG